MKSILITGCSSGIGYHAAHALKARGWRVFATCRKPADCARLETEGLESFPLDYIASTNIKKAVAETLKRTGGTLDAIFNNGAHATPGMVEDLPRDALRQIYETNLFGPFELINLLMPTFRAQGHGRIINCSSVLGLGALKYRGAYNSTKFAMEGLTDTLRLELRDTKIHVSLIEPGPIPSRIRQNSQQHFERWIDWENSGTPDIYKSTIIPRLYETAPKADTFQLPPSAVTKALIHAIEAKRPNARYFVTTATWLVAAMRILPTWLRDAILARN